MVVVELPEVFKAFPLDIVHPLLWSRPLTLQLRAVVYGVFRVFSQNRAQQRLVKQIIVFQQRLSSRWLIFPFSGGGLQDLRPGQSSASSSHSPAGFADDANQKKVRHYLRTRGRNCLRTRADGRRLLMTSPWRSRRRSPRTSRTLTSTMWSLMGAGGGVSGSRLASRIAGGWPRQMGPKLAILSGGPSGSSAVGQGDWDDGMVS